RGSRIDSKAVSMNVSKPAIKLAEVSAGYGDSTILQDVSVEVGRGEFLVVEGPSGAGKTTLLRLLYGTIQPRSGVAVVDGVALARAIAHEPRILLADEPTGNLDRGATDEVMDAFEAFHERGGTVVVATHDEALRDRHARRVLRVEPSAA